MSREISGDILKGIAEALDKHAPHLRPTIDQLIANGLVDGPKGGRGSSVWGKLTATIPWADGEPVLLALEEIERQCGYQKQFGGRQINLLVQCWRRFAEPRQIQAE